jgi:hypothetical protein
LRAVPEEGEASRRRAVGGPVRGTVRICAPAAEGSCLVIVAPSDRWSYDRRSVPRVRRRRKERKCCQTGYLAS